MLGFKRFLRDEEASGVVELILIFVVLVALVVLFKSKIKELVDKMFAQIDTDAPTITKPFESGAGK